VAKPTNCSKFDTPKFLSFEGLLTFFFPVYSSSEGVPFKGAKAAEGQGCPRCGFAVYAAEQMISKGKVWHKRCFSCFDCHKSLDSTNLNDSPTGEIYCRGCYGRNFGPRELKNKLPKRTICQFSTFFQAVLAMDWAPER
jgi:LIM domain